MVKSPWDVVIVGAGPGGSMAALGMIGRKPKANVLLLERRRKPGYPYQCGGGIVDFWLHKYGLDPPKKITSTILKGFRIYATDGSFVEGSGLHGAESGEISGRILDRAAFDNWLARKAEREGAALAIRHTVTGASPEGLKVTAPADIAVEGLKGAKEVKGASGFVEGTIPMPPYLVCADGWASKVGARLGFDTSVPPKDMYRTLQYTIPVRLSGEQMKGRKKAGTLGEQGRLRAGVAVEGGFDLATLDRSFACFVFGRSISNTAYAWAFPEGGREENLWRVGTGCTSQETGLRESLERFIDERVTGAGPVKEVVGGWIPVGMPPRSNAFRAGSTEVYLVGDAARVVCPLTGGGLANAFMTGDLSAGCIADGTGIKQYDRLWKKEIYKELKRKYKLRRIFMKWNDEEIGRVVRAMGDFKPRSGHPRKELGALVRHVMKKEPRLFFSALGEMMR